MDINLADYEPVDPASIAPPENQPVGSINLADYEPVGGMELHTFESFEIDEGRLHQAMMTQDLDEKESSRLSKIYLANKLGKDPSKANLQAMVNSYFGIQEENTNSQKILTMLRGQIEP